jgi:heptaprenyl diphosphate synthase
MTDFWKDAPEIEARLARVVALIDETLVLGGFPLQSALAEAAGGDGKLLRPALLVMGSLFGRAADTAKIEALAAAIELLHVATLVHDDIIDEAPLRRGQPSLHSSLGVKRAVLAGDWLFSRCFLLASEGAAPETARGLSRLVAAICSAEISQDLAKFEYSPSFRAYYRTIAGKTAALFSLALHAGASEAKAAPAVTQGLRRSGYCMGMAFQVIDDILDFESEENVLRKPVGKDIAEGLCTLPLIHAMREDPEGMSALLEPLRGAAGEERVSGPARDEAASRAAARAAELGGVELALADARRFTDRALREIGRLPPSRSRDELAALAERLLHRAR